MNCRRMEPLLSKHLDGSLSARQAERVAAHLRDCPACRRLRDRFTAIGARLREPMDLVPALDVDHRAIERWMAERALHAPIGRRPLLSWPLPPLSMRSALWGAAVVSVLMAAHSLAHWEHGRQGRSPRLAVVQRPVREQGGPEPRPVTPPPLRMPGGHDDLKHRVAPGVPGRIYPPPGLPITDSVGGRRPNNQSPAVDDLAYVNSDLQPESPHWVRLRRDEWDQIEARIRRAVRVHDDFITIPFPRIASTSDHPIAQAVESYKREAAIVDPRLSHEVTCAFKATALSDLCDRLRADTGTQLSAGPSVADEKVTLFCEKMPLREVMRQLSRPFGYTWLRSKKEGGEYRYELVQDLKSQLLEEELRNRDRYAALITLEREMDRYRPYLPLSPDEALVREKTAPPDEKKLLHHLANKGWGPVQMYFRLSRGELEALRAG